MTHSHQPNQPILPRPRRTERWAWALLVLVTLLGMAIVLLWQRSSTTSRHADQADHAAGAVSAALSSANARLESLGARPIPEPSPGAAGAVGPQGPGPTDSQISAAVDGYCALHAGCIGTPSEAEVLAAVKAYCSAGAVCRGSTGATGPQGPAGQQGNPGPSGAAGAQGPGPTQSQIGDAVAAYCAAHNQCQGPSGPPGSAGPTGATGAAGRGIASVDCRGGLNNMTLTIHYDDGTDQTVDCAQALPTPSPSP